MPITAMGSTCWRVAVELLLIERRSDMFKYALIAGLATGVILAKEREPDKRLQDAAAVVNEMMGMPDKGIPKSVLDKAQCIVVIPGLKKAAFVVGGQYGRGYVSCRKPDGAWGPPAAAKMEGGSFGFQLGGQSTDVIMLAMNQRGMDKLLSDKFTIGADAAAAAGPVGRDAKADTDLTLHAELLTYARSRGAYAGLSLEGATLRPDNEENKKLYGRDITNKDILVRGEVSAPEATRPFLQALNRSSR
jgi:SH3 domain-containing YSC84-like protein 1